ncbi:MAG: 50S ribosomal protein L32 [Parcubacteria group bacterium]|nr:50S ribosomal protein L32 [Parcubacteria group bacterium]
MVVRMRSTRSHTRNRRSHHKLMEPRFSICAKCGAKHIRHVACLSCGTYRERMVLDVAKKAIKKERKAKKRETEVK